MKLSVKALALTSGILWGLGLFFATWWIILMNGESSETTFIGMIYRGYSLTPLGSVFGLVWGFFDGLIGGAIFAWLYNLLAKGK
ncbi:MAG: bacteriophage holin [Deltaproteobacteria bacterium]|nr:bacteriophage holin [Candidatus Zymogenaceae bacterium]